MSSERQAIRKKVKHQIMEVTSNDELISFTFDQADTSKVLRWKHSKEFEYNNEMYDVVRREYHGDQVTYFLWWDHDETKLNRKVNQLASSLFDRSPTKERSSQQLSFFLSQLYTEEIESFVLHHKQHEEEHFFSYLMNIESVHLSNPSPPPKDLRIL
tara:strand:+ start:21042 stop:21512 length:471 start_codon:yes stop_codon:yes gene_type:complete